MKPQTFYRLNGKNMWNINLNFRMAANLGLFGIDTYQI